MDRLATEGTYFSQAAVTTPICAASRASILSGVYETHPPFNFQTGNIRGGIPGRCVPRRASTGRVSYRFLREIRYSRYDGEDRLFDEYETYDRNNAFPDRRGYYYKTLDGDSVHLTRYTGQQALDFVDRNADTGQPFCLSLSFSAPHAHDPAPEQYFWQPETDALLPDEVPAPALADQKYFDALPAPVRAGFNRLRWTWRYDTPEKYQHSVKGYFRMIAGIDLEIGKLRAKLAERGLDKNTVIIVMGDNGYFLGERQLAGKWLMYDNSVRVPLIVYDPRAGQHHDSDALALNIDVPATIVDLAGLPAPAYYQGKSLLPIVDGNTTDLERDTVLIEHIWEFDNIPPSEGVRTRDWKYFRYLNDKGSEELYHLADDPAETVNLATDPAYDEKLREFRQKCDELVDKYSDDYSAAPTGLSVEYLRAPAGLPLRDPTPDFGWVVPDGAAVQGAYQLLVADNRADIDNNVGNVWNSKRVVGSASVGVTYAGPALEAGKQYYWSVRIWDDVNRLTRYSAAQQFTGPEPDRANGYLTTENRFQIDTIAPVLQEERDGALFLDFGKDGFANMSLTYAARRPHTLTVSVGELLDDAGLIDAEPGGTIRYARVELPVKKGTHTYMLPLVPDERNTKPAAARMPDSFPVLLPFRYAMVEGVRDDGLKEAQQLVYRGYWDEAASDFTSSDSILNQIWELCRYTIKATTFAGLYVDGDRERIPYEADAYLNQLSHYTTDREYAIGRRTIEYFMQHPTWPTEWQQHVALMFWADYMYTGNTELIEKYYEDLKYKTLVGLVGEDHLVSSTRITPEYMLKLGFSPDQQKPLTDIVDWPPAGWNNSDTPGERDGFVFMPNNTVINALFYRNMEIMAEFAGAMNLPEEQLEFQLLALQAKQAVNDKLLDKERGIYVDGEGTDHASVHANMFPLAFNMVPDQYVASVGAHIKSRGMAASVYGAQYLMEALYNAGMADYALELLTSTDDRSWYNMIHEGSTMTMEAWGYKYKTNLDLNHAWGAVPANIIPRQLWGIQPKVSGYGVVSIRPQMGSLERTSITVPTLRGEIRGEYAHVNDRYQYYTLHLPGNMVGEFYLDVDETQAVTVNGQQVNPAFGTVRLGPGKSRVEVRVNSF